jgi:hypothetical protein
MPPCSTINHLKRATRGTILQLLTLEITPMRRLHRFPTAVLLKELMQQPIVLTLPATAATRAILLSTPLNRRLVRNRRLLIQFTETLFLRQMRFHRQLKLPSLLTGSVMISQLSRPPSPRARTRKASPDRKHQ